MRVVGKCSARLGRAGWQRDQARQGMGTDARPGRRDRDIPSAGPGAIGEAVRPHPPEGRTYRRDPHLRALLALTPASLDKASGFFFASLAPLPDLG